MFTNNPQNNFKKKVLNFILKSLSCFSSLMLILYLLNKFLIQINNLKSIDSSIIPIISFTLSFWILYFFNKRGFVKFSAYSFLAILVVIIFFLNINWGIDNPLSLLLLALFSLSSSLILGNKFLPISLIVSFSIIFSIGSLQINDFKIIKTDWKLLPLKYTDLFTYILTISLISTTSWLYSSELRKALKKATQSEIILTKQKNLLEKRVKIRSQQLIDQQKKLFHELYNFIEIGKNAAGLYHDLINPLNTILLITNNLEDKIKSKEILDINKQLIFTIKRTNQFINLVNKQVKKQNNKEYFFIDKKIKESIELLNYKAQQFEVKFKFNRKDKIKIYGNPTKFKQVINNILANSIDAYKNTKKKNKLIKINVEIKGKNQAIISITDFGKGISKKNMKKIFKPFFTTKNYKDGTGLGLNLSKKIINEDYRGKINIKSKFNKFTEVTVSIPL